MEIRKSISNKLFFERERDMAELFYKALIGAGYDAELDAQDSGSVWVTVWKRPEQRKGAEDEEERGAEVEV